MRSKKPIIGITLSQANESSKYRWPSVWQMDYVDKGYHYGVEKAGGIPVGLHNTKNKAMIEDYLDRVDGVVFTGGTDLNSKYYGQKRHKTCSRYVEPRDWFELEMTKRAFRRKIPLFFICRGQQMLNVARGGNLYQDTGLIQGEVLRHPDIREGIDSFHPIKINKGTLLYEIIGKIKIKVNSAHHQAINNLGDGLVVAAVSYDGVIEALDMPTYPFLLSVQWHPERLLRTAHSRKMYQAFIDSAIKYKRGTLR